ncbi:MAG: hypothetical protein EBU90_01435 [Proteobacteria bacterium]|nr:hypothetical protein [Pseudomonadota bacterium]
MIQKELTPDFETDSSLILAFCGFYCEVNPIIVNRSGLKTEIVFMTTVLAGGDDALDEEYSSLNEAKKQILSVVQERMTNDLKEEVILNWKN